MVWAVGALAVPLSVQPKLMNSVETFPSTTEKDSAVAVLVALVPLHGRIVSCKRAVSRSITVVDNAVMVFGILGRRGHPPRTFVAVRGLENVTRDDARPLVECRLAMTTPINTASIKTSDFIRMERPVW